VYLYVWVVSMCLCCIQPDDSYVVVVVAAAVDDVIAQLVFLHILKEMYFVEYFLRIGIN